LILNKSKEFNVNDTDTSKLSSKNNKKKFYNNLLNVAKNLSYSKCNPWLGQGPTVCSQGEYKNDFDLIKEKDKYNKKLSIHNKPFINSFAITDKDRKD